MDFDLDKMRGQLGQDGEPEVEEDGLGGLAGMMQDMMQSIFGEEVPEDLGELMKGIDAGELTNMMLDLENSLGMPGNNDGGEGEFEEVDFEELLANYKPSCDDERDVSFKELLKSWLRLSLPSIDEPGITMLGIELDEDMDFEEGINLAYNDGSTVWDIKAWLDSNASTFDDELFDKWYFTDDGDIAHKLQNGDEDTDKVFDIIVIAVSELIRDGFIESCFGRKIPFVISNGQYDYRTALWSVRASGREAFDKTFFEACGLYDDDEDNEPNE